jgi:hypothetical protein
MTMRQLFRRVILIYFVLMFFAVFLTDWSINEQDDFRLLVLGIYTPIVASSVMVAGFAIWSAVKKYRKAQTRFRFWPPEWDHTVAGWAGSKAQFFTVLWFYGARWTPPDWVLLVSLSIFAIGHLVFDDQWFGEGHAREEPA